MTNAISAVTQQIKTAAANAAAGGAQQIPGMTEAFGAVIALIEKRATGNPGVLEAMALCRRAVGLPAAEAAPTTPSKSANKEESING